MSIAVIGTITQRLVIHWAARGAAAAAIDW
jgi:hypothetical protein